MLLYPVNTSLVFGGGTGDRVDIPASPSINTLTKSTVWFWVYLTTITANRRIAGKAFTGGFKGWDINLLTSGFIEWFVGRATTNMDYKTSSLGLTTTKWQFVCCTYDESAGTPGHVYVGDQDNPAAEPSYSTTTAGAGSTSDDSAVGLSLGNLNANSNNVSVQGRLGLCGLINRTLSLSEVLALQVKPDLVPGTVGLWDLGSTGTALQRDLSGQGNHGVVAGATLGVGLHDPLEIRGPWTSQQAGPLLTMDALIALHMNHW